MESGAETSSNDDSDVEPVLELIPPVTSQVASKPKKKRSAGTKNLGKGKKMKSASDPDKEVVYDVSSSLSSGLTYRHTIGKMIFK